MVVPGVGPVHAGHASTAVGLIRGLASQVGRTHPGDQRIAAIATAAHDDPARHGPDLVLATRSTFEGVVTGLSSVQSLSPDQAQIVLRFVNAARQPVSGVVIAQPTGTVAYDAGNSYTDTKGAPFGATQQRGMAIIVNYTSVPFPGGPVTVQYVKPGATMATPLELRAANGAVTFRTVVTN